MAVSLEDIKKLRELLGTGMVDTKKALEEAGGDVDKATEILRLKGAKGNAKRADRATSEGLVAAAEQGGHAFMIELACETDFVAKNDKFISLANDVLEAVVAASASNLEDALKAPLGSGTVEQAISDQAAIIGEKVELRRISHLEADKFAIYLHRTNKDLPPQVGVVVGFSGSDDDTARSIAQHISFADPQYLSRDEVPADVVDKERALVEEISRNEGKPEAALPKIVEGRLGAFFKQIALLDQEYARDNKLSIAQVVEQAGLSISNFSRFKVGA
jgi:elongation factor Ts